MRPFWQLAILPLLLILFVKLRELPLLVTKTDNHYSPSGFDQNVYCTRNATQKPIYLIGHRVLAPFGVHAALAHGSNALEVDVTAWRSTGPAKNAERGWRADHGGIRILGTWGETARDVFTAIARARMAGNGTTTFVWLDIKTPDYCDPNNPEDYNCSIAGLRDLVRETLEPAGIRVLYGFYTAKPGIGHRTILDTLNANEAVNINGKWDKAHEGFTEHGPANKTQRVMAYGFPWLSWRFGDCSEPSYNTCTELRLGAASTEFGKVLGWTSTPGFEHLGVKMLEHSVDGLIVGCRKNGQYREESCARETLKKYVTWIGEHAETHCLATQENLPW